MTATKRPTAIWRVVAPPVARDGDSLYLIRERELFRDEVEVEIRRDVKRVLCRCAWLACPEISGPNADPINGPAATRDAQFWLDTRWNPEAPLVAYQFGFEKYGRPLIDLQTASGESFSQWMMTTANGGKGWLPYEES